MNKRIFLYSHGSGTHADDNGLFSPIIDAFPDVEHVLFPYDDWNSDDTIATAATFTSRAQKLRQKYTELRQTNPNAEINLICHSQGCIIAALAQLENVSTTILLAPVINYRNGDEARRKTLENPKSTPRPDGSILRKRSAGYYTLLLPDYWEDYANISGLPNKYDNLSTKTKLIIFDAVRDTVIPNNKDYSLLKNQNQIEHFDLDHDFIEKDGSRSGIIRKLKVYL